MKMVKIDSHFQTFNLSVFYNDAQFLTARRIFYSKLLSIITISTRSTYLILYLSIFLSKLSKYISKHLFLYICVCPN